jgi:hypothetical protein
MKICFSLLQNRKSTTLLLTIKILFIEKNKANISRRADFKNIQIYRLLDRATIFFFSHIQKVFLIIRRWSQRTCFSSFSYINLYKYICKMLLMLNCESKCEWEKNNDITQKRKCMATVNRCFCSKIPLKHEIFIFDSSQNDDYL